MNKIKKKQENLKKMVENFDILNFTLKVIFCLVLIVILFGIWSYYLLKVSVPFVEDDVPIPTSGNNDVSQLNPLELFCSAQLTVPQTAPGPEPEPVMLNPCPDNKVQYNCDLSSPSYPDDYTMPINICTSSKEIDNTKSWCDSPGLNDTNEVGEVTNILRDKIIFNCCKDKEYQSNLNYSGIVVYLIFTVIIGGILAFKMIKFIYPNNNFNIKLNEGENIINGDNIIYQASDLILGKIGTGIIVIIIIIYFILFPIIRYFFVSYRCENVPGVNDPNCNKPCENNNDCTTLNNSPCSSCINSLCMRPQFSDYDTSVNASGINISVCGISSIIDHLKEQEIQDIYDKFIQPLNPGIILTDNAGKKEAIINHLSTNPEDNNKITSYYYRFYPRQEIIINDTLNPFSVRLPNPSIVGYNYLLNNFIQLDQYSEPNDKNCSVLDSEKDPEDNITNELVCNNNHNCKWNQISNSCENSTDCPNDRYILPTIDAVSAHQTLNDSLDLHNKVIRPGNDYNETSNAYPDNLYPCNDVVFSNNLKIQAKNDITTNKPISDMDDWINHFELKRDECSDKMGQCYLKDYVCENNSGYPIPLKNLQLGSDSDFTIGSMSDIGCQKALYPCSESEIDNNCMTIEQDENGYIVEKNNGGICKTVYWNPSTNSWDILDNIPNTSSLPESNKCIPSSIVDSGSVSNPIFIDANVSKWITDNSDVTTHCKSVYKVPRSNIDADTTMDNYYRWSSVSNDNNILCFDWSNEGNSCLDSKIINNLATFREGQDPQVECCIDIIEQSGPINLYIEGTGVALPIDGVEPTQIDP